MDKLQKKKQKSIAKERIEILFKEADNVFKKYPGLANRYVEMARKIAMKTKLKMPKKFKRRYCRNCHSYFKHGVNCRVRVNNSMVLCYCFNCKKYTRIPFKKEKSSASYSPGHSNSSL